MSEQEKQEKWMPGDEEIMVATVACFRDEGVDPIRALIRTSVERALAEQEAGHWREAIEARIEEIGKGLHVLMSGGVVSGKAHAPEFLESHCVFCRNIGILRAQLTALEEAKPYGWTSFEWAKEMRAKLAALEVKP